MPSNSRDSSRFSQAVSCHRTSSSSTPQLGGGPADEKRPRGLVAPKQARWCASFDCVSLSTCGFAFRERLKHPAGFRVDNRRFANEKLNPFAVVTEHLCDDHSIARIHGAATPSFPGGFLPSNDIRFDEPTAARKPPCHVYHFLLLVSSQKSAFACARQDLRAKKSNLLSVNGCAKLIHDGLHSDRMVKRESLRD